MRQLRKFLFLGCLCIVILYLKYLFRIDICIIIYMYISTCVWCVCPHTLLSGHLCFLCIFLYSNRRLFCCMYVPTQLQTKKKKTELPVAYSISYLSFLIRTYNFTISTLAYYECVFKTSLRMNICFQHFLIKKQCCIKIPSPTTAAYPLRQS